MKNLYDVYHLVKAHYLPKVLKLSFGSERSQVLKPKEIKIQTANITS